MRIYDLTNCPYSNRNGSYGGAAGDKDGILIEGEAVYTRFWDIRFMKQFWVYEMATLLWHAGIFAVEMQDFWRCVH